MRLLMRCYWLYAYCHMVEMWLRNGILPDEVCNVAMNWLIVRMCKLVVYQSMCGVQLGIGNLPDGG